MFRRRARVSMFQVVAMINFTEVSTQGIYIICHVYKNINIGDFLVQVYKSKIYYYGVKNIFGYKDKSCLYAEEGYNYKIEIELTSQFNIYIFKNLKYGSYIFSNINKKIIYSDINRPNFELPTEKDNNQFYKYAIYYKNYNKTNEIQSIINLIEILQRYGYNYCYDTKGNRLDNICNYLDEQINNGNKINSIHIASKNNQFYIHGVLGLECICCVNKIDILLPERCHFVNDETNNMLYSLFQDINISLFPLWSYLGNSENIKRFSHLGGNLPTSVHHINYYNTRLIRLIRNIFDIELPEYLICREFPFNNLSKDDLDIQEYFYYTYKFDKMSIYLQKHIFESEQELLLYCKVIEC